MSNNVKLRCQEINKRLPLKLDWLETWLGLDKVDSDPTLGTVGLEIGISPPKFIHAYVTNKYIRTW